MTIVKSGLLCLDSIEIDGVFSGTIMTEKLAQFNAIYGWNASGKSTLCRLLRAIELRNNTDTAKFKVTYDLGSGAKEITHENLATNELIIKVFNQDFVDECIQFQKAGRVKGIVRIGSTEIGLKDKVLKYTKYADVVEIFMKTADESADVDTKNLDKLFQNVSQLIRTSTLLPQSYNKNSVESAYKNWKSDASNDLKSDLPNQEKIARSLENKDAVKIEEINFNYLQELFTKIATLYSKSVTPTAAIEALAKSSALEMWVKEGLKLHNAGENCTFCDNRFTADRKDSLLKHFSNEFGELERDIYSLKAEVENIIEKLNLNTIDAADFYEDHQNTWRELKTEYNILHDQYKELLRTAAKIIGKKTENLYQSLDLKALETNGLTKEMVSDLIAKSTALSSKRKTFIEAHNDRAINFKKSKDVAVSLIKKHYLEIHYEEYLGLTSAILQKKIQIAKKFKFLSHIKSKIAHINKEISSTHLAAKEINSKLHEFLGHDNIELVEFNDVDGTKCYQLQRNTKPAKNLCEAEKNAIALIYFIESLNNDEHSIGDTIVVMDDPISSYDSANMYNAMAFMKIYISKAKQLIILTHNYSAFAEIRKWFHFAQKTSGVDKRSSKLFQISRANNSSKVIKASQILQQFHTEYEFLFSELKNQDFTNPSDYVTQYYLLNAARRVLEVFLTFKQGSSQGLTEQIRANLIKAEKEGRIGAIEWRVVNDLINQGSHANMDIAGAASFALAEHIKEAVIGTLKLIEEIDPDHYLAMAHLSAKATNNAPTMPLVAYKGARP